MCQECYFDMYPDARSGFVRKIQDEENILWTTALKDDLTFKSNEEVVAELAPKIQGDNVLAEDEEYFIAGIDLSMYLAAVMKKGFNAEQVAKGRMKP